MLPGAVVSQTTKHCFILEFYYLFIFSQIKWKILFSLLDFCATNLVVCFTLFMSFKNK